jgi:hypothetical protein
MRTVTRVTAPLGGPGSVGLGLPATAPSSPYRARRRDRPDRVLIEFYSLKATQRALPTVRRGPNLPGGLALTIFPSSVRRCSQIALSRDCRGLRRDTTQCPEGHLRVRPVIAGAVVDLKFTAELRRCRRTGPKGGCQ